MGEGLAGGGFGGEGCGGRLVRGGRWGARGEVSQGEAAAEGGGQAWDVHCFLFFFCVGCLQCHKMNNCPRQLVPPLIPVPILGFHFWDINCFYSYTMGVLSRNFFTFGLPAGNLQKPKSNPSHRILLCNCNPQERYP